MTTNHSMQIDVRWREDELVTEISGLSRLIAASRPEGGAGAKCARNYLKQVLRDRREALRLVRYLKRNGDKPAGLGALN